MEKQIMLPLNENLKRIISRSLQKYREELLISDSKINKSLYHVIVQEEVQLIEQVLSELEKRWKEAAVTETFIDLHYSLRKKRVKEVIEQLPRKPNSSVKGFTEHGQLVEVKYTEEVGFTLMLDGEYVCQDQSLDLVLNLFISMVG